MRRVPLNLMHQNSKAHTPLVVMDCKYSISSGLRINPLHPPHNPAMPGGRPMWRTSCSDSSPATSGIRRRARAA